MGAYVRGACVYSRRKSSAVPARPAQQAYAQRSAVRARASLRDMARDWATNESPVTEFRKVRASGEPEAFNRDAYATMAQMGWAGVIIPEEHGGSDFGFLSAGLVVEEGQAHLYRRRNTSVPLR